MPLLDGVQTGFEAGPVVVGMLRSGGEFDEFEVRELSSKLLGRSLCHSEKIYGISAIADSSIQQIKRECV